MLPLTDEKKDKDTSRKSVVSLKNHPIWATLMVKGWKGMNYAPLCRSFMAMVVIVPEELTSIWVTYGCTYVSVCQLVSGFWYMVIIKYHQAVKTALNSFFIGLVLSFFYLVSEVKFNIWGQSLMSRSFSHHNWTSLWFKLLLWHKRWVMSMSWFIELSLLLGFRPVVWNLKKSQEKSYPFHWYGQEK